MGTRSAVSQLGFTVPALVGLSLVWLFVVALGIVSTMNTGSGVGEGFIGQNLVAGLVGLAGLGVVAAMGVALADELGREGPVPQSWPPEE